MKGIKNLEAGIQAGDTVYAMTHAYHHVICTIVSLLGQKRATATNIRWIYSCARGWTEFFKDGAKEDTTFHIFPDGEITWIDAFSWNHPIPGGENKE